MCAWPHTYVRACARARARVCVYVGFGLCVFIHPCLSPLGVPHSFERAVELYNMSAAQGNRVAMHNLAECYELGQGNC